MPEPTLAQFRARFIMHLTAALRGRMEFGHLPLGIKMAVIHSSFCNSEVDLAAAKIAVDELAQEWLGVKALADRPSDDVWQAIAEAIKNLAEVIEQAMKDDGDPDAFIGAVFRCRDWIMGLDLILRTQRGRG